MYTGTKSPLPVHTRLAQEGKESLLLVSASLQETCPSEGTALGVGFSGPEREAHGQVPATLLLWPPTLSLDTFAVSPSNSLQSRSMDVHPIVTGGSEARKTEIKGLPTSSWACYV